MDLLKGIKIIDFTRLLPGPVATHLLAQMGAEVNKIESPKRPDYVRMQPGQVDGASTLFHQLNHNKISKIIDYSTKEGHSEILEMVKTADAVIEQFRPGAMDAWGFSYEDFKKINPKIVYVSLTGYGQSGEFSAEAGHDVNYLAYAGIMSLLKDENGKPIIPDTQFADISGAFMAVIGLQGALVKRSISGEGSYVDVALSNSVLPFLAVPYGLYSGGVEHRKFNVINGKLAVNYAAYQCADGKWISVGALEIKFWNNLCSVLNKPEWIRENQLELMNQVFPKQEVEAVFKTKTRDEWAEFFIGKDCCVAPVLEIEELENHPFHKSQNSFEAFETPRGAELKTIRLPFKMK